MKYAWDEKKRKANLKRHGVDFKDLSKLFEGFVATIPDDRFAYSEERFFTLGILNGQVIAVSHTENEEIVRIISARKAEKYEKKLYLKEAKKYSAPGI